MLLVSLVEQWAQGLCQALTDRALGVAVLSPLPVPGTSGHSRLVFPALILMVSWFTTLPGNTRTTAGLELFSQFACCFWAGQEREESRFCALRKQGSLGDDCLSTVTVFQGC